MKEEELAQCKNKVDCLSQENKKLMDREKSAKDQLESV